MPGRRNRKAHRVVYELASGEPIPNGLLVCYRCDNPPCVNPAHLFLGTHQDDSDDMIAKGRRVVGSAGSARGNYARGVRHPACKLTEDQVRAIISDPRLHREIAAEYGVTRTHVSQIKRNMKWRALR